MVEGRRRFLDTFADIEEGRRCDQLAGALSRFCDGELADGEHPGLLEHLGRCAYCRAKLRAFRETPRRVLQLAPFGMFAGPSVVDRAGDRVAAAGDRAREIATSLLHRGGGAVDASQTVAAGGGPRGSGLAVLGVVCGLGVAGGGGAVCVDQGVLPDPFGGGPQHERQVEAAPSEPAAVEPVPADASKSAVEPANPTEQRQREFGVSSPAGSSGGTREFGAPPSSSSSSSAGGGGSGHESFGL
jgi:hypothetical protein